MAARFIETMYFWDCPNVNDFGWNNQGPELQSEWMRYHVQGGLEVLAQMLDYYDSTQDADFSKKHPAADGDATDHLLRQHWKRDFGSKIHMERLKRLKLINRPPPIRHRMSPA